MARYKRRIYDAGPSLFDDLGPRQPDDLIINRAHGAPAAPADNADPFEPMTLGAPRDVLRFISFGSGSSGNSAYIGDNEQGLIIDAGIDRAIVTSTLERHGIPMSAVRGILITHDHGDHLHYLYSILRKHRHIPLFCTPRTLNGMLRRHSMSRRVKDYHRPIYKEIPFDAGPFKVTPFEVSHDGTDNVGYHLTCRDHTFVIATDLGVATDRVIHYVSQANYLMLESNYDRQMLVSGTRPEYLKARILSQRGHMDNADTAALLRQIWSPRLRNIFLCHLSEDNNTPDIALRHSIAALIEAGAKKVGDGSESLASRDADVQLVALPRFDPTPLFTLSLDKI